MASEWRAIALGEVIDVKHGFAFPGEFIHDEPRGDILLTPGNFAIGGGFKSDKYKFYEGPVPAEFVLHEGDLLISMTDLSKQSDTLGFPAFIPVDEHGRRYLHNQRLGKVIIKDETDTRYLHYLMCSADYRHEVLASATGTTVKHTSPDRIKRFRFSRPPLEEQRAIAHVLGALDNKIELNRRMNETLEAMARALFKSWFVDFDPVRARAKGLDPGLPKPVADLFPDRLESSELGMIPAGWEVKKLEDVLAELETGGRPKGGVSEFTTGVPSIGAESIVGLGAFDFSKTKYVPLEYFDRMKKGRVRSRDVLLYKDGGRPGEFEPHVTLFGDGFPFEACAINEHVYRLRAIDGFGQNLLFCWLSSDLVMDEMRVKGTGVAIPGLNSTQVKSLTTLVPAPQVSKDFEALVEPLIGCVLALVSQR